MELTELRCKFCGSPHIIRYGHYRGMQRWWCKSCQRKFVDNDALPGMKTPIEQVAEGKETKGAKATNSLPRGSAIAPAPDSPCALQQCLAQESNFSIS